MLKFKESTRNAITSWLLKFEPNRNTLKFSWNPSASQKFFLNESENEEKETQIMLKTSNLNLETKKVEGPEIEKRIKFTMTTGPIQV